MTAVRASSADGAKVYSPALLLAYDLLVLGLNARLLWGCPAAEVRALYDANVTDDHLDIGVGTGYFLDRCRFPSAAPRVCLFDLSEHALAHASRRISRYAPEVHRGDVLERLPFARSRFRSVGMSALLHCLPGNIDTKAVAFQNVARCLAAGGRVFGATVVNVPERMSWLGRRKLVDFNRRGIFSNLDDKPEALERVLARTFEDVQMRMVGSIALFSAAARPLASGV